MRPDARRAVASRLLLAAAGAASAGRGRAPAVPPRTRPGDAGPALEARSPGSAARRVLRRPRRRPRRYRLTGYGASSSLPRAPFPLPRRRARRTRRPAAPLARTPAGREPRVVITCRTDRSTSRIRGLSATSSARRQAQHGPRPPPSATWSPPSACARAEAGARALLPPRRASREASRWECRAARREIERRGLHDAAPPPHAEPPLRAADPPQAVPHPCPALARRRRSRHRGRAGSTRATGLPRSPPPADHGAPPVRPERLRAARTRRATGQSWPPRVRERVVVAGARGARRRSRACGRRNRSRWPSTSCPTRSCGARAPARTLLVRVRGRRRRSARRAGPHRAPSSRKRVEIEEN